MRLTELVISRLDAGGCAAEGAAGRGVQNALMEARNIANHPFLSRLHDPAGEALLAPHPAPAAVRLSGKLEARDRLLPKLKAGGHRVRAEMRRKIRIQVRIRDS